MTAIARTISVRLCSFVCALLLLGAPVSAQIPSHGPAKGCLIVTGVVTQARDYERLVQLGGGSKASIVVIPNGSVTKPTTQAAENDSGRPIASAAHLDKRLCREDIHGRS